MIVWAIFATERGYGFIGHPVTLTPRKYLDDPVLAELWENEEDAVYDEMGEAGGRVRSRR